MLAEEDLSSALHVLNELTSDELLASDADLGAILRAIALRSRVEIARRERKPG